MLRTIANSEMLIFFARNCLGSLLYIFLIVLFGLDYSILALTVVCCLLALIARFVFNFKNVTYHLIATILFFAGYTVMELIMTPSITTQESIQNLLEIAYISAFGFCAAYVLINLFKYFNIKSFQDLKYAILPKKRSILTCSNPDCLGWEILIEHFGDYDSYQKAVDFATMAHREQTPYCYHELKDSEKTLAGDTQDSPLNKGYLTWEDVNKKD